MAVGRGAGALTGAGVGAGRRDPETAEVTVWEIRGCTCETIWETMSDWRLDWEREDCWLEEEEDPDPGRMTVKPDDWGLDEEENPEEEAPEEDWDEKDELPDEAPDEDPVEDPDEAAEALIVTKFS